MIGIFTERKIALSERQRAGHDVLATSRVFLPFLDRVIAENVTGAL